MADQKISYSFGDGLTSLVSGLGATGYDKRASLEFTDRELTYHQLRTAYRNSWVVKKIINIPAKDAGRNWRAWQAEKDQIEKIEAEEKRLNLRGKIIECKKKARLLGGSAILIGTGDQDPSEPLDPKSIKAGGFQYATVFMRHHLVPGDTELNVLSPNFGQPKYYEVVSNQGGQVRIHPSRLIVMEGESRDFDLSISSNQAAWGDSVLQSVYDTVTDAGSVWGNIASLVFEANIDVLRIAEFMENLAAQGHDFEDVVIKRFQLQNLNKSINRALIVDKEDEYERKQINFSQLPDLMQQFMILLAGAADIPVTRFFGQSPAGMSSTGDGDMNNYHDHISSIQELEIEPAMSIADEVLIRSALGDRPEEISYEWRPLKQMTAKEIAEIGEAHANIAERLTMTGALSQDEIRQSVITQFSESGVYPGLDVIAAETQDFDLGEGDQEEDEDL